MASKVVSPPVLNSVLSAVLGLLLLVVLLVVLPVVLLVVFPAISGLKRCWKKTSNRGRWFSTQLAISRARARTTASAVLDVTKSASATLTVWSVMLFFMARTSSSLDLK